ncbi:malonate decarboxylase holo-[acyl-carrier-protein] synthase [Stenotrophomonas tumulicola]|uniref:Malonate decarboxylase holo-[acyl-carrier-protein] synthase n=1 Tax=Stenotrophomonas tumulicola TaxID=1685415 RepID=A0A7W3IGE0_9GAMM|nr:malonate decarboxylase holo-[acyl-carrier-protein] synthase [Stenotrophomonas tumulicola]MBA8680858.1 malonate decarboxylase holo-[acyl-carrier-protein] synthase [Stenotrophomonas tumulicola]
MHRHDLAWIEPHATWTALLPQSDARLRAWARARLPLVVARRDPAVDGALLRLGVPLPLAEQRQRLALRIDPAQVLRHSPPLTLEAVIAAVSAPWRTPLQALLRRCSVQPPPRVFGSFAWQALTGLDYLHAGSDLDLLWDVASHDQAKGIARLLHAWESEHGLRADGELRFPGARSVNWREYAGTTTQVLVKADAACWLSPRTALIEQRDVA